MRYLIGILLLASPALASDPVYSWKQQPDPDWTYLYQDGKFVGGWNYNTKQYRSFNGANWGAPVAAAPVKAPANRVIVTPPATPQLMVMPQPSEMYPQLRGPLRRRAGSIFADIMTEATMRVISEIPGAIKESIRNGNYQLNYQYSVNPTPSATPAPKEPEVKMIPPSPSPQSPSPPARGPLRRLVMPRP